MITFATFHADLSAATMELIRGHEERTGTNSFDWSGAECPDTLRALIQTMFASVSRMHSDHRKVILTDQGTSFESLEGVDIFRSPCSSQPALGRSTAWVDFLRQAPADSHIVFLDYDMLIQRSLEPVFESVFDVGLTFRIHHRWPINAGIQFVHASRLERALGFYEKALATLSGKFVDWTVWCGDQWALQELVHADFSGRSAFHHTEGGFDLLLLPGEEYNYSAEAEWHFQPGAYDAKKVLHFKGSQKPAMFDCWNRLLALDSDSRPSLSHGPSIQGAGREC